MDLWSNVVLTKMSNEIGNTERTTGAIIYVLPLVFVKPRLCQCVESRNLGRCCTPIHFPPLLSCNPISGPAGRRINSKYRGRVIPWVKGTVCFVFEISIPFHFFPSPLCDGSFKTKQAPLTQ